MCLRTADLDPCRACALSLSGRTLIGAGSSIEPVATKCFKAIAIGLDATKPQELNFRAVIRGRLDRGNEM